MTRFARAKGSKASNERLPDEPTPWHVMKQQLEDSTAVKQQNKAKSAKELLRERDEPYYGDIGNQNNDWAEFEAEKKPTFNNDTRVKKNQKDTETDGNERSPSKKSQKQTPKVEKICEKADSDPPKIINIKKDNEQTENSIKLSKRQKRNRKNKLKQTEDQTASNVKHEHIKNPGAFNTQGNEWTSQVKFGNKNQLNNEENSKSNDNNKNDRFSNMKVVKKRKPPKVRDEKEHKRRKPNPGVQKVIINGIEVEIVLYDGFPVKKDDADRLIDLRKQMVMKAIPKSEINAAMKLERRKAEKNLARIRKNVCFHCRKAGHNLSDCPELGQEEKATGICFKCGSGEHTHFECKIMKKDDFGFAKCFICREQGHIAKQCPDNPKGLYPQGGACKICGDVTHLKKDCPDLAKDKEESTLTLDTISSSVDGLQSQNEAHHHTNKPKQKIVTF